MVVLLSMLEESCFQMAEKLNVAYTHVFVIIKILLPSFSLSIACQSSCTGMIPCKHSIALSTARKTLCSTVLTLSVIH